MELITILSTIILIATISTFILSIGAYILFKIRSRKEQKIILQSARSSKAELITADDEEEGTVQDEIFEMKNERTKIAADDQEDVKTPKRIIKSVQKIETDKSNTPRFKKYSTETLSQFDNDNPSRDLKWR